MSELTSLDSQNDYEKLVADCKVIVQNSVAAAREALKIGRWELGHRILQDYLKFKKPEYGEELIKKLSKDIKINERILYRCIRLAKKFSKEEILTHESKSLRQLNETMTRHRWTKKPEECLTPFNFWFFHQCDPRFGSDYPGKLSGQVVINLLHFYTNEHDTILDPFAGSGTVVDVANHMGRKCISYDLNPQRKDIKPLNILNGLPLSSDSVDLAIADPPYWNAKKGEYTKLSCDLSQMTQEDFYKAMDFVAKELFRVTKVGKCVALIMGNKYNKNNEIIDLVIKCSEIFEKNGLHEINRIPAPYSPHIYFPWQVERAIEMKKSLNLDREIIVFRKMGKGGRNGSEHNDEKANT